MSKGRRPTSLAMLTMQPLDFRRSGAGVPEILEVLHPAGVVHEDVEAVDEAEQLLQVAGLSDVGGHADDLADLLRRRDEGARLPGANYDSRPRAVEPPRDRLADAARPSGDQRRLPGEAVVHGRAILPSPAG